MELLITNKVLLPRDLNRFVKLVQDCWFTYSQGLLYYFTFQSFDFEHT